MTRYRWSRGDEGCDEVLFGFPDLEFDFLREGWETERDEHDSLKRHRLAGSPMRIFFSEWYDIYL